MQLKIISGSYLTATNIKHIKALFDAKLLEGKVNRINYYISVVNDSLFTVNIPIISKSILTGNIERINHITKFQII